MAPRSNAAKKLAVVDETDEQSAMSSLMDNMTLDEIDLAEDILAERGMSLSDIGGEGKRLGPVMRALVYVLRRRNEPDLTPEDLGGMTMSELNEAISAVPTER